MSNQNATATASSSFSSLPLKICGHATSAGGRARRGAVNDERASEQEGTRVAKRCRHAHAAVVFVDVASSTRVAENKAALDGYKTWRQPPLERTRCNKKRARGNTRDSGISPCADGQRACALAYMPPATRMTAATSAGRPPPRARAQLGRVRFEIIMNARARASASSRRLMSASARSVAPTYLRGGACAPTNTIVDGRQRRTKKQQAPNFCFVFGALKLKPILSWPRDRVMRARARFGR